LTLFLPPPIVNVVIRWAQGQNFGANTNAVKFPIEDPAYPAAADVGDKHPEFSLTLCRAAGKAYILDVPAGYCDRLGHRRQADVAFHHTIAMKSVHPSSYSKMTRRVGGSSPSISDPVI
jgi:hypothetical protein